MLNIGLRGKLILSNILIITFTVTIFGVYVLRNSSNAGELEALKNGQQIILQGRNEIKRNIEICQTTAQSVMSNKEFILFIAKKEGHTEEEYIDFRANQFESIMNLNINNLVNTLRIFVEENLFDGLEMHPLIYLESRIKDNDWWSDVTALKGRVFWRLNHEDTSFVSTNVKPETVVSLYREVTNNYGERVGVLEVNMRAKEFFSSIYSGQENDSTFLCLIKGNSEVVMDENNALIKKAGITPTMIIQELVGRTGNESGHFKMKIENRPYLVVYDYIEGFNSYLYCSTSLEYVANRMEKTRNITIVGVLLSIVILSLANYFIVTVLLKKMQKIIISMRKIQEGDLNTEIPVLGSDEVGELAFHFKKMMQKVNELISIVVRKQAATKDAEIRALQTQINAHFIYNVLETIRMMALLEKKPQIADTVTSLGGLMRYSMSWKRQYVPLRQEIESVRNYINLVDVRSDFVINLVINIEERFYDHELLKMTLQPIVENSFTHGIEPCDRDGTITIEAFEANDAFIIEVTDNGMGMTPEELNNLERSIKTGKSYPKEGQHTKGNGIGLGNVNERIILYYGNEYGLDIFSEKGSYTTVRVRLPYWKGLGVDV